MPAQERYRIMIVDDDEDLRALMRAALSSKYEVVEAFDGLDALHKLAEYQPDLAIIDVEMPLMNGLDLCASIRKHKDFRGIPVLFLSAHGTKEEMKRGYEAGADLFMVKPIEPLRVLKNVDFTIEHDKPPLRRKKNSIQAIHQIEAANKAAEESAGPGEAGVPMGDPVLTNPAPPPRAATPKPAAPPPRPAAPEQKAAPRPAEPEKKAPATPARPPEAERKAAPTTPPEPARASIKLPPGHPATPPEARAAEARPARPASPAGAARARIMIVDNEEDARQLIDLTLRDQFEITTAHDGLDAIEKLVGYQPDILLVDVMMPRMNGFHLLQSIRRNPNYQHLPVMIITGRASDRDREYAMKVGANDFLPKPFATDELVRRVRELTKLPLFRIAPKKVSIEEIIEREFLITKEKQKEQADQKSRDEYKRVVSELKDVMSEESKRQRRE